MTSESPKPPFTLLVALPVSCYRVPDQPVNDTSKRKGLLVDEVRSLKLSWSPTLSTVNCVHATACLSYATVLSSATLEAVVLSSTEPTTEEVQAQLQGYRLPRVRAAELGEWTVDEVQLCEMGS
ncbi:hypothetical protein OBBRIDRAFT_838800 [Obba rivulosa]|uniref:Uncharacterized protein n=1 Tax=Obba rivulosa TaxID=1052685 RepID=A0A8E2APK4_9APHY|nr:hypothetical protein OBBRIDRAFT_838800 [Obba rivulosa]